MVKKNSNFKFKATVKKAEKKPRKMKSSFIPYDDSLLLHAEDNTEDLIRTYLRDTGSFRSGGGSRDYYDDDYNNSSLW